MMRRRALVAGVAVAATAAGAGVAWQRRSAAEAGVDTALWRTSFERPGGGQLGLASFRGRPLLLNFWATWCPPCVAELPLLDQFQREQSSRGWQVVGLAVDKLEPVVEFLARRPVGFAVGLAGMDGIELARRLGNTGGGLPFSAVFGRDGRVAQRKLGVIAPEDLNQWVASVA